MKNEKKSCFQRWLTWGWGICAFVAGVSLLPAAAPTLDDIGACEEKIEYQNKCYFAWNDGVNGEELWIYDAYNGRDPELRKDIRAGSASSTPREFIAYNEKIYFVADDGVHGPELWMIDGEALPVLAYDFPGSTWYPRNLVIWTNQEKIYFITSQVFDTATYIYSYDGVNPPVLARNISNNLGYWPTDLLVVEGEFLLLAKNNANPNLNPSFWKYDGTNAPVLYTEGEYHEVPAESASTGKGIADKKDSMTGALTSINFKVTPNIQNLRPTSASLCWKLSSGANVHIILATNSQLTENRRDYEVASGTFGTFTLSDLHPNKYWFYYVYIINSSSSHLGYFRTPIADGDKTSRKIVIIGDTRGPGFFQTYGSTARIQMDDAVLNESPDLIVHLGDMAYTSKSCYSLPDDFFGYYRKMLTVAAWLPTYGNHEFQQQSFSDCSRIPSVTPYGCFNTNCSVFRSYLFNPNQRYYRYDYQNIRFLNLFVPWDNSTAYSFYQPYSAQYNWLLSELQTAHQDLHAGKIDFIIPVFHRPMATINNFIVNYFTNVYNSFVEEFKNYGVKVVFTACAHDYQHFYLNYESIDYYVSGGGGTTRDISPNLGSHQVYNNYGQVVGNLFSKRSDFHYLVLTTGITSGKSSITIKENIVIKTGTRSYILLKNWDPRTIVRD